MTRQCDRCRMTADVPEALARDTQTDIFHIGYLCPSCARAKRLRDQRSVLLCSVGVGLLGVILVLVAPESQSNEGWFFINLFLFHLSLVLTIVPHELGHAIAAQTVGFRVYEILIGFGTKLWSGTVAGFPIVLNSIPIGGLTRYAPREIRSFKRKQFLTIAAGPLVNLACVALLLAFLGRNQLFDWQQIFERPAPLTIFFWANVIVLTINLWPRTTKFPIGEVPTDGKQLLTIPFYNAERIQQAHAGLFLIEAAAAMQRHDENTADEWIDKAAQLYPQNPHVRSHQVVRLMRDRKFAEARELSCELLKQETKNHIMRALHMNNIAYANLLLGDPKLLPEADKYSQEAMTWIATAPAIRGTRGSVLVELGNLDDAHKFLAEAFQQGISNSSKAENACWLAILFSRERNLPEAQKYLEIAKILNPDSIMLQRAQRELALNPDSRPF